MVDMLAINAHSRPAATRRRPPRRSPLHDLMASPPPPPSSASLLTTTCAEWSVRCPEPPSVLRLCTISSAPRRAHSACRAAGWRRLGAACALLLGIPLDKTQQTSDWSHRR